MKDKRSFDRFLLITDIEQQKKESEECSKGHTKNISSGGICITTEDKPLDRGSLYILRFTLPGCEGNILEAMAKAVWSRDYKTGSLIIYDNGLEFVNMGEDLLEKIEEYKIGSVYGG
jgi:hypothetical protein